MYSLDINLLRERAEYQTGQHSEFVNNTNITAPSKYGKIPLFVGIGVAALTLLSTGGGWLYLGQQTERLEAKQKDLDRKLGSLKAQDARIQELNTQLAQINEQTQSLAGVFNQVQPWSAVLQDLRESIPQGVQIASISQSEVKAAAPAPTPTPTPASGGLIKKISTVPDPEAKLTPGAASTPVAANPVASALTAPASVPAATLPSDIPTTKVDITGTAKTFDEVNNFILTLKQSTFFNPDDTQLLSAGLTAPVALTKLAPANNGTIKDGNDKLSRLELPKVVEYRIQTSLKRIPASDLIRELERKGAVGLVSRLKSLQQQQVIKP